ncbi:MAG: tRNA (guanosine(18)-2'-O)-methyltransferase TrmH [Chlorobiales bacterium]|nr:tRNA (guanosine(18)-2'-O)-methyltransferase TrmH [Chlorobiales bacterium]
MISSERFSRIKQLLSLRQPDLTVLMDNVNKPHNLSAVIRSCDAVGIETVHAVSTDTVIKNRQRAARGSNKWVTLVLHENIENAYAALRKQGMQILVAHYTDEAVNFRAIDYSKPTAVVMGAELFGPSESSVSQADHFIYVPMQGMVESLNVSVAAAVILFEAQRQRLEAGLYNRPRFPKEYMKKRLFELAYPSVSKKMAEKQRPYPELDSEGKIVRN